MCDVPLYVIVNVHHYTLAICSVYVGTCKAKVLFKKNVVASVDFRRCFSDIQNRVDEMCET